MEVADVIENNRKAMRMLDVFLKVTEFSVGTTPSEVVYTEDDIRLLH